MLNLFAKKKKTIPSQILLVIGFYHVNLEKIIFFNILKNEFNFS